MLSGAIKVGVFALLIAYLWQNVLHDFIYYAVGVGRTYNRIEEYPYICRQLRHSLLESCEDMVLDPNERVLYAACSTSLGRKGWSPGELTDHVSVLNIDEPGQDGLYGLHELEITGGYRGSSGGKDIDVLGITIEPLSTGGLRFWVVNPRPAVDESGKQLDANKVGANSTIEGFDLLKGSLELKHVKTVHSDAILTPNSIEATGDGGFLFTNDHGSDKTSLWREVSFLFGPGSVGYCSPKGECKIAYSEGSFSNGIVKGNDGLYYVAQSSGYRITVLALQKDGTLVKIDEILVGMTIDNLSKDTNGDLFVAGFPKVIGLVKSLEDPVNVSCPSTVFRIRRTLDDAGKPVHEVTKVLEDIEAKVLPCSTVAVHDAKTDTFFLGSVTSPFITVCKRQK